MALSDSLRKVASKTISKLGGEIYYVHVTNGGYDVTSGRELQSLQEQLIRGVFEDVTGYEVSKSAYDSPQIRADDKKLTIAAAGLSLVPSNPSYPEKIPSLADQIRVGSEYHQIIRIDTIEQNNQPIAYVLYLRQ